MNTSTSTTKRPSKIVFSKRIAEGEYREVPTQDGATGATLFRNDSTSNQFKNASARVQKKLEDLGFKLYNADKEKVQYNRSSGMTVEEFLSDAPF